MATHKLEVLMSNKVYKQIKWFTHNMKTEIGALGKVKIKKNKETGEKYYYVYELLFPKQRVTGATVEFDASMWGELVKEHGLDGLKDINFYWHRHPGGSPSHSGTDDEDTFETFMSPEANRPYFIFVQTASKDGKMVFEIRVDIRRPVRATITGENVSFLKEVDPEDEALREECEAIKENCIVKEARVTSVNRSQYQNGRWTKPWSKKKGEQPRLNSSTILENEYQWGDYIEKLYKSGFISIDMAIEHGLYGDIEINSLNNDMLSGEDTEQDYKLGISFENGQATLLCGKMVADTIEEIVAADASNLAKAVRQLTFKKKHPGKLKKMLIQPKAKMYKDLKCELAKFYMLFCEQILLKRKKGTTAKPELEDIATSDELALANMFNTAKADTLLEYNKDSSQVIITGTKSLIQSWTNELEYVACVDWNKDNDFASVISAKDDEEGMSLGTLMLNDDGTTLTASGERLVLLISELDFADEEETEEEE